MTVLKKSSLDLLEGMSDKGFHIEKNNTDEQTYSFGKSVLIVENDLLQAYILERMLAVLGCKVIGKSRTGEEAIDLASKLKPDVLLMDISLDGEKDGISAVVKIHEEIKLPVVYITGNWVEQFLRRTQDTDFIDFISKPITMNLLIQALKKMDA